MSEKERRIHNAFCDYQIAKANNQRNRSVRLNEQRKVNGIKQADVSKRVLAHQLAQLF